MATDCRLCQHDGIGCSVRDGYFDCYGELFTGETRLALCQTVPHAAFFEGDSVLC
jgi:hypothetical protein